MNLCVLGILLWREKKGLNLGQLTGLMLILHGTSRIVYEFWRAGSEEQVNANLASSTYWGSLPFTQAQAMAGGLVLLGTAIMVAKFRVRVSPGNPRDTTNKLPAKPEIPQGLESSQAVETLGAVESAPAR